MRKHERRWKSGGTPVGQLFLGSVVIWVLAGCHPGHNQSSLHPASYEAAEIARLWWVMFAVLTAAFVLVVTLAVWAVLARKRDETKARENSRFVVWGGVVFPVVVLVGLLFYMLRVSALLRPPEEGLVVQVTGHMWWWEVRYPDLGIITANEIHLPVGEPVRIQLRSGDVNHSFWVPSLHGKMDANPGMMNEFWLNPKEIGVWRGQCAEFCGRQHALMAFEVVALAPEHFQHWTREKQRTRFTEGSPPTLGGDRLARGKEVFFKASCHECHAIGGTRADGLIGPDLTHIGSRGTLGAGTVPNTTGNLMGWIVNPQEIKPGNLMPRTFLEPNELRDLVHYLQSLE